MLRLRIITAICLFFPALFILWFGGELLEVLLVIMLGMITSEYFQVALARSARPLAAATLLIPLGFLLGSTSGAGLGLLFTALIGFSFLLIQVERDTHEELGETLGRFALGVLYCGVLGTACLAALQSINGGPAAVWFVCVVAATDTAAYFGGHSIGGGKLAPRISPNKTVSGALSGLLLATVVALFFGHLFGLDKTPAFLALAGVLVSVISQIGDLVESLIKRQLGVKDMGSVLPGHGGVLDRIDGYLFAAPVLLYLF